MHSMYNLISSKASFAVTGVRLNLHQMLSVPLSHQEKSSDATNQKALPPSQGFQDTGTTAVSHSEDGRFATTEGTIYVSKPFRSRTTKKLRAMITFEARKTHFD